MSRFCVLLVLLLAVNAAGQKTLLPLAEYEVRTAEQAIVAELARTEGAAQDSMAPDVIRAINQYRRELISELQRVRDVPNGRMPPPAMIVRGVNTAQYPSVGALLYNAETVCSGTLIGRSSFLSASHCFERSDEPRDYAVYLQHSGILAVARLDPHPQAELDIMLLTLQQPVTGIATSKIPAALTSIGQQRQIVGFGVTATGASDSGIKRQGGITTSECHPDGGVNFICWDFHPLYMLVDPPSNVCSRDSGGPVGIASNSRLIIEEGVAVRVTPGINCQSSSQSWSMAIRPHAEWLNSLIESDEPSLMPELPVCCGEGVTVLVKQSELPKSWGTWFEDFSFEVPDKVRVVRVALNAIDIPLSNLELSVRAVVPLPVTPGCKDLGRYESCEYRFEKAPPKFWAARVENSAPAKVFFQLVVTMFELPDN